MNALNALLFALLGFAMESLPHLFPTWFPRNCADRDSTQALWLAFVGGTQVAIGAAFIGWVHILPALARAIRTSPAGEAGTLPLPVARGMTGH
jgi:hypothetical protein